MFQTRMETALERKADPCLICGQDDLDEQEMRSHMLAVHALSDITCPMCPFGGVTADEMSKHINSCHFDLSTPTKLPKNELKHRASTSLTQGKKDTGQHVEIRRTHNSVCMDHNDNITRNKATMEEQFTCPICTSFSSDSVEILTLHVNQYHFNEDSPMETEPSNSTITTSQTAVVKDSHTGNTHIQICTERSVNNADTACAEMESNASTSADKVPCNLRQDGDVAFVNNVENKENVCLSDVRREDMSGTVLHCPVCDETVQHGITLEFHLHAAHPEFDADQLDKEGLTLLCPVCGDPAVDPANLQRHVDEHFTSDDHPASTSGDSLMAQELERREKHAVMFKQSSTENKKQKVTQVGIGRGKTTNSQRNSDVALSRGQTSMLDFCVKQKDGASFASNKTGVDDGSTASKGIIEKLRIFYRTPNKFITGHWIASPLDHYCSSYADKGWGCGYRNFQMMLSCLVRDPLYKRVVFNGKSDVPSVPKIQKLIEEAWASGFDPQGREQLSGRLSNTKKWIGATEIFTVLASLKVKCQLVDFYRPTGPDGTHPRLFQWVQNYFQAGGFKPPLYLQHQGHSRTIVGVEENKDDTLKLILFDPGTPRSQMQQFLRREITPQLMRVIRRLPNGMKAKQYQILAVRGILTDKEQQEYKLLKSDRVP